MRSMYLVFALTFVIGCGGADVQSRGQATFVRPANEGGTAVPQQSQSSDLQVRFEIDGTGTFEAVDRTVCSLTSGSFSEQTDTNTRVESNGSYASSYSRQQSSGTITNPLCGALRNLQITSVSEMRLAASVPASSANCDAYCQAQADAQCETSADRATCSAAVVATCSTQCQQSSRISGSGSASASALAQINSGLGNRKGMIDAQIDLVLTTLQ